MGFLLLDRPNPNGAHYYKTRNEPLLAIVVHVTAGAEDLDALNDLSAENVAHYAATTDRGVSWHTGSDTDSWVDLLPSGYTAWHATAYNSCTHGHEISKRTTDWRTVPAAWVDKTLRMAALGPGGNGGLRAVAQAHSVPLRKASRAELDEQRANFRAGRPYKAVGFISHAELQPEDRTDPGWVRGVDTFPWSRFFDLLNGEDDFMADIREPLVTVDGITYSPAQVFHLVAAFVQAVAPGTHLNAKGDPVLGDIFGAALFTDNPRTKTERTIRLRDALHEMRVNAAMVPGLVAAVSALSSNPALTPAEIQRVMRDAFADAVTVTGELTIRPANEEEVQR